MVKCESEQFQKKILGFFTIEYVAVFVEISFYSLALADLHILN